MPDKELSVRLHGTHTGMLRQTLGGQLQFEYADTARQPVSLSMPIEGKKFGNAVCESFFGGLLPESDQARRFIGLKYHINPNNTFSLLGAIGYDCAGAISLQDPQAPEAKEEWQVLSTLSISEKELAEHIKQLPQKPLFLGVNDIRLSLAGMQDKAAIILKNNQVHLPAQGCPTTHILKPAIAQFSGSVQNEYLCMRLAAAMKIITTAVEIRSASDVIYLLIERYDREIAEDRLRRIHQEDFCQALAIRSTNKYQKDGGPGFKQCFELMTKTTTPGINRNRLMELLVFNLLIGNADAHGKNFSLLYKSSESTILSPAYDLLSTCSYLDLSQEMAMKIGSTYYGNKVTTPDLEKFCQAANYSFPALRQTLREQCELLPELAAQERELLKASDFDHEIAGTIVKLIEINCKEFSP